MDERMTAIALRVMTALAADEEVVARVAAAARRGSPDVARLPEEENRRHVATLLADGTAHLERGGTQDAAGVSVARALGADRALQGVPIASLLRGVHAGRTELVRAGVELARGMGVADAVILDLVVVVDHYVATAERDIVGGYRAAELDLSRTVWDLHARVLGALFASGDLPGRAELERAGLSRAERYHCVVTEITDPVLARGVERSLDGVFGLVEGRLAGLARRLSPLPGEEALFVCSPALPLAEVGRAYPACVRALGVAAASGDRGVRMSADLAVEAALAAQPELAATVAGELLGALDPGNAFHRELAGTALCYLDHGRRVRAAADALHVHVNTVRYRLERLAELTGTGVHDAPRADRSHVVDTAGTWWALRTWLGR
ncbi:helix-turn-helix domain-containing protein [Saccharopolyspora gregorii]|uniref:Helix-turn-helix domain-containing protein n=1 Tax=Saccharopolyspora gregorii TaxID=33914 RepID=A0ABP6S1I3_9PSEU